MSTFANLRYHRKISIYGGPETRFVNGLLQLKDKRDISKEALSLDTAMIAIL